MAKTARKVDLVHYVRDIPEVVSLIKEEFGKAAGVKRVFTNIRVVNQVLNYVFIDANAAENCQRDMVLPKEVGIKYSDPKIDARRHPRLWLEERAAEVRCEKRISELAPHLNLEWVTFLQYADGRTSPVG